MSELVLHFVSPLSVQIQLPLQPRVVDLHVLFSSHLLKVRIEDHVLHLLILLLLVFGVSILFGEFLKFTRLDILPVRGIQFEKAITSDTDLCILLNGSDALHQLFLSHIDIALSLNNLSYHEVVSVDDLLMLFPSLNVLIDLFFQS